MTSSYFILDGFKDEVSGRIHTLLGDYMVSKYGFSAAKGTFHISAIRELSDIEGIAVVPHMTWGAIIINKKRQVAEGVMIRAIPPSFLDKFMVVFGGEQLRQCEGAFISRTMSGRIGIGLSDSIILMSYSERLKVRKVCICGLFSTSVFSIDEGMILLPYDYFYKIFNFSDTMITGASIYKNNKYSTDEVMEEIRDKLPPTLEIEKIENIYPQIFKWLETLNINVVVLQAILSIIMVFTVMATGVISFLDRIRYIAFLNAIGFKMSDIVGWRGIITLLLILNFLISVCMGITISVFLSLLQNKFHLIKLDPEIYFIDYVPLKITWNIVIPLAFAFLTSAAGIYVVSIITKKMPFKRILHFE